MEELTHSARWAVSHGALTMYKTFAPQIFINDFNPISLLYQSDPDFFERDSLPSIPQFLKELDSKIQLVLQESAK